MTEETCANCGHDEKKHGVLVGYTQCYFGNYIRGFCKCKKFKPKKIEVLK